MMVVLGPSDKVTHALLASYIVSSDGYEKMRDITSNCKGFLPIIKAELKYLSMHKIVWSK